METNPMTIPAADETAAMASAVTAQYAKVCEAVGASVREMVIFGAMLNEVDRRLKEDGAERNSLERKVKGMSLHGWLELNCPEVNYKTAMSYRAAAAGAMKLARLAEGVELLPLVDERELADAKMEGYRQRILKVLTENSMRVLRSAANGAGKTGRPPADGADFGEYASAPAVDSAVVAVFRAIEPFLKHRGALLSAVKLVPVDKLKEASQTLAEFNSALMAEIATR